MAIMSMARAGLVAALATLTLLAGCDEQRIKELEEGLSTEVDVRDRFGVPEYIWQEPDGSRTLEYNRQPAGERNYMITIGTDGKMSALRQVLTPQNFEKILPGMRSNGTGTGSIHPPARCCSPWCSALICW